MKRALCLVAALFAGCAAGRQPPADILATEDQKTVYAIGLVLSQNLESFRLTPAEAELVRQGMADGMAGRPRLDVAAYRQKVQQLGLQRAAAAAEAEKKESRVFLEAQAKEEGAEMSASGLVFIPLREGAGPRPAASDIVRVHYQGTLRDGTVFDSSVKRGTPATFVLNRVISCWTEGVQKMKVGGKAKLVCPPSIAYGDRGAPPAIKPGAVLIFEVELLGIEAAAESAPSGR